MKKSHYDGIVADGKLFQIFGVIFPFLIALANTLPSVFDGIEGFLLLRGRS